MKHLSGLLRRIARRCPVIIGSLALLLGALAPRESQAQESDRIRVFLDCQTRGCDFDHFRREIEFVDWVNDPADSDVHLLLTSVSSGSGRSFDLAFLGRDRFLGEDVAILHNSSDTDTEDERREGLTRAIGLGLVQYARETEDAAFLSIRFDPALEDEERTTDSDQEDDPWNFWTFRIEGGGEWQGESQQRGASYYGQVRADRTTEGSKVRIRGSLFYQEDEFDFGEETLRSIARANSASVYLVRSIGDRFGTGVRWDLWNSTYSNIDIGNRGAWAFEYNVFPYSQSTRRELTVMYTVGLNDFDYLEPTIFDQTRERVADHALEIALGLRQPWGDASFSLASRQFLHDPDLYRISVSAGLEVRLFRGLSVSVSGWYQALRDQLSLRAGTASEDEILLRRTELRTEYRTGTSFGFTYRFGSIFNNVVNPRLNDFDGP